MLYTSTIYIYIYFAHESIFYTSGSVQCGFKGVIAGLHLFFLMLSVAVLQMNNIYSPYKSNTILEGLFNNDLFT